MPQFSIKTLLIVVTVVALWLSTLTEFIGAWDIRCVIIYLIFFTSSLNAYLLAGRRKAFWLGFAFAMFWFLFNPDEFLTMRFDWARDLLTPDSIFSVTTPTPGLFNPGVSATIEACVILLIAAVTGLIGVSIYDRNLKP